MCHPWQSWCRSPASHLLSMETQRANLKCPAKSPPSTTGILKMSHLLLSKWGCKYMVWESALQCWHLFRVTFLSTLTSVILMERTAAVLETHLQLPNKVICCRLSLNQTWSTPSNSPVWETPKFWPNFPNVRMLSWVYQLGRELTHWHEYIDRHRGIDTKCTSSVSG